MLAVHQQRVEVQLAVAVVLDRHDERVGVISVDDAPDDVRGSVAKEQR